jgi:hypothetical protein
MKKTFTGSILLVVCAFARGQVVDTSQHFLWFSGHLNPAKKNVFIIAASGGNGGGTITIGNDGAVELKTGGVDAWNKKMDQAEQAEQRFIQQLDDPKDNLDPSTHQLYQLLKPDAEQRKQEMHDLKIDAKQDMMSPETKPGQSKPGSLADAGADACKALKGDYDQVMAYYKSIKGQKDNELTYPPPPAFEYNCYACDSNVRNSYQQTIDNYVRDFFHPEDSLITRGYGIIRQLALLGIEPGKGIPPDLYWDLFSKNKKDPSKSGACAYMDLSGLSEAVLTITIHAFRRADKMMHDNRKAKNFKAVEAIAKTWLTGARMVALTTGNTGGEDEGMADLADLLANGIDYYYGEFRKNDWRQIGNLTWMLGLMRQQALLGAKNDQMAMKYLNDLQRIWNGFRLTIEMDVKIGEHNGYRLAHLKGDCHIVPSFQRDSNQCYKWVVADENQMDLLGFIKPAVQPTIDCQLITNELILPPQAPKWVYTGTHKYTSTLQSLSMDFCNPGHDTIQLSGFTPVPATAGTWQIPYSGVQNLGVVGMEQYFEDMMAKKKLADNGEANQAAEEMKRQGEELKKQMDALKNQMTGPQGGANYEKIMELANRSRQLATSPVIGKILWLDFLLPVQNNDAVLVNKKYDAKELNPRLSAVIVYGYYTIHIENKGDGKSKPIQ